MGKISPLSLLCLCFVVVWMKISSEESEEGGEVNKKKFCGVKKMHKTATQFGGGGD